MATIAYNPNIPLSTNNPSNDQPKMQTNTNAINTLIGVDHFNFNVANGGWHQQSTYVDSLLPLKTPITILAGQAAIYSKNNTQSQLFATSDAGAREYQLTRFIDANIATFGTSTNYPTIVANQFGGWTFLPGNLLLQYGTMLSVGKVTTVAFPITYTTTLFSLTATRKQNGSSDTSYGINNESVAGFDFDANSSTVGNRFYWMAIGV